jgi:hypothetical protein
MNTSPIDKYRALLRVVRTRFDMIEMLKGSAGDRSLVAEACAFHGRKIVEGIAFGCLIAVEHGLGDAPRDAKGKWNADAILTSLKKKNLGTAFPSPSIIRAATAEERREHGGVGVTIEGQPDRRMTLDELLDAYTHLHRWNHEINPYVDNDRQEFLSKHEGKLWDTHWIAYIGSSSGIRSLSEAGCSSPF